MKKTKERGREERHKDESYNNVFFGE